ncbi:MAG: hypothetical protein ACOC90_06165 [Bacteroidota bacterium]
MKTRLFLLLILLLSNGYIYAQDGIIVDHRCRDLSEIPSTWIDSAKKKLYIGYGHTSHGSQLTTGMNALEDYFTSGLYNWSHTGGENELHLFEGSGYDSGYLELDCGYDGWDDETREYLDDHPDCNVIIWSWCGQVDNVDDLQSHYLDPMTQLENEYPEVTFVYMTGHLEGKGPDGSVFHANQEIREYCDTNNKVLYDFADIEKYSPDADTNYQHYGCDDGCNYDPDGEEPYDRTENWASNWINSNPDHELTQIAQQCGSCAHSEQLNCVLKGIASWHLWARIAGWPDNDTTSFTSETGNWSDTTNWDNGLPDSTTNVIIPDGAEVTVSSNVRCSTVTVQPEGTLIISAADDTLTASLFTLKSNPDTAITGTLLNHGFMDIDNEVRIERHINKDSWHGLSSSVSDATAQVFNAAEEELYQWDYSSSEYTRITDSSTSLTPMQGYLYRKQSSDTIITFSGSINQGGEDFNLIINEEDTLYKGWNLVGNPYCATLDWNSEEWDKTHVANSIYFYGHPSGQPYSWVNGISNPHGYADGTIPTRQAFWVYAREEGSISVTDSALTSQTSSSESFNLEESKSLRFRVSDDTSFYENIIIFDSTANHGFDPQLDAFHMPVPLPGKSVSPGLYSLDSANRKLAVNTLPQEDRIRIYMGVSLLSSGEHTIEAIDINNIQIPLYLIDKVTRESVEITSNDYTFTASAGAWDNRFILTSRAPSASSEAIQIDHLSRDFSQLPGNWLDSARQKLHIGYGHTGHGSQLTTGMNALEAFFTDGRFAWSHSDAPDTLHMFEGDSASQDGWLGKDCSTTGWDDETREYLDAHPECNVIIWSWSGLENTVADANVHDDYLRPMEQLEAEYPGVRFVYMTGPMEGLGPDGAVKTANDSIRDFCEENNKILFDFADIEKYSPDRDTNYQHYGGNSACDYDPDGEEPYERSENWAASWVSQNPDDTLTLLAGEANAEDCEMGHTHCLNGVLKGIAAWHLWTRLAGWEGSAGADQTSFFTAETGSWEDGGNWDNGIPDSTTEATIPSGADVTVSSNVHSATLTVQPGAMLTINNTDTLTTGRLTLKSKPDTALTATLFSHGYLNITDEARVERFVPANSWEPITPPVANATAGVFNAGKEELYRWDRASGEFVRITDSSTSLTPMQGYLYRKQSSDTIITFSGSINQGGEDFNLIINEEDTLYKGWNLVGNPYCATLDWNSEEWDKTHVANSIYFYRGENKQPCSYVNGLSNPEGCSDGIIPPMEAFWVYAHQEGKISVNDTALAESAPAETDGYLGDQKSIRLQVSDMNSSYETLILFNNNAKETFENNYDAFHMPVPWREKPLSPGVYSLNNDQNKLSINSRPDDQEFSIPLGFSLLNEGNHTFEVSEINHIYDTLYLRDQKLNEQVIITETDYSFTESAGKNSNRFILTTKDLMDKTTSVNAQSKQKIKVYGHNGKIYIIPEKGIRARVRIVDMNGRLLYDNMLDINGTHTIPWEESGLFVVILQTQK